MIMDWLSVVFNDIGFMWWIIGVCIMKVRMELGGYYVGNRGFCIFLSRVEM